MIVIVKGFSTRIKGLINKLHICALSVRLTTRLLNDFITVVQHFSAAYDTSFKLLIPIIKDSKWNVTMLYFNETYKGFL